MFQLEARKKTLWMHLREQRKPCEVWMFSGEERKPLMCSQGKEETLPMLNREGETLRTLPMTMSA